MDLLYARRQDHEFNTSTSVLLSYKYIIYKLSSLWYSINIRAIYIPTFIKPVIFYQFQIIIQPRIHQVSNILSILENFPAQHSPNLWYSINIRVIYSPSFIKPMIFYQFQSIIQPRIHQASDLLSASEQYTQNVYTLLWKTLTQFWSVIFKTRSHISSI